MHGQLLNFLTGRGAHSRGVKALRACLCTGVQCACTAGWAPQICSRKGAAGVKAASLKWLSPMVIERGAYLGEEFRSICWC